MADTEIWKDIEECDGQYQISNMGNIRGVDRYVTIYRYGKPYQKLVKGTILKKQKTLGGYSQVLLHFGTSKKIKSFLIAHLVAKYFVPNPDNKPCIDHINTKRDDDRAINLRWVTHKENCNNPITIEHYKAAKRLPRYSRRKPVIQYSKDGTFIRTWDSAIDASNELNIHLASIYGVCVGAEHYHTAGGYIWKYAS